MMLSAAIYIMYNTNGIINAFKQSLKFHPPREDEYGENGLSLTIFEAIYNDGMNMMRIKSEKRIDSALFNDSIPLREEIK